MSEPSPTITVTDQTFEEQVINNSKPVLVDFWAPWCGPCKTVGPVLEEIASEHDEIVVAKLNVDEQPGVAGQLQIRSIPTMVLFSGGEAVEGIVGAHPKEAIIEWVGRHVALNED